MVAGYGWCGKGIALRAKGLGASVIVTEIDPIRAIEAKMDGFEVMPMIEAVKVADIIISATGCKDVVRLEHLKVLRDGCIMGNSGHFDNEISKRALEEYAGAPKKVREFVDEYSLPGDRKAYLLGEGRLMNLAAGQGHPVEIMDMSFSIQALAMEHLVRNHRELKPQVYEVPRELDQLVANIKLRTLGVQIDSLTKEQERYLGTWQEGT